MNTQNKKHQLRNWLLALLAILIVGILVFWPTDYFIESPGEAVPVSQFIKSKNKSQIIFILLLLV